MIIIKKIKENFYKFVEDILFVISFIILIYAMFKFVSLLAGFITLSIVLFIIAIFITLVKRGGENK